MHEYGEDKTNETSFRSAISRADASFEVDANHIFALDFIFSIDMYIGV